MRTHQVVLAHIEDDLTAGRIRLGDRLPGERALAERLGVSRPSVREAIKILEALGVIRTATGSGPEAGATVVADPAAFAAKDRTDNEHDWLLAFQKELGLKVHKAKSNSAGLRNQAIWTAMDTRDGYAVDPACRHLIKGHSGVYRYAKAELKTGELRAHLEIAETIYTHVCDAEQYAALEGEHVIGDLRGRERRRRAITNDSDFDVHAGVR